MRLENRTFVLSMVFLVMLCLLSSIMVRSIAIDMINETAQQIILIVGGNITDIGYILLEIQTQISSKLGQVKADYVIAQINSAVISNATATLVSDIILQLSQLQQNNDIDAVNKAISNFVLLVNQEPLEHALADSAFPVITRIPEANMMLTNIVEHVGKGTFASIKPSICSLGCSIDHSSYNEVWNSLPLSSQIKQVQLSTQIEPEILSSELKLVIQQIIIETSILGGQSEAQRALKETANEVENNEQGPLSQSLYQLAFQRVSGNTEPVDQAIYQVANLVAEGGSIREISSIVDDIINPAQEISPDDTNQPAVNETTTNNFLTYDNPNYGVKIQYPVEWIVEEPESNTDERYTIVATLWAPIQSSSNSNYFQSNVIISIDNFPGKVTMDEYVSSPVINNNLSTTRSDLKVITADSNAILAGHPAYNVVMTYRDQSSDLSQYGLFKLMDTGTIIDDKVYIIQFYAQPETYSTLLPTVQKMIDSFQITK